MQPLNKNTILSTLKRIALSALLFLVLTTAALYFTEKSSLSNKVSAASYDAVELDMSEITDSDVLPYYMSYDKFTNSLWIPALSDVDQSVIYQYEIGKNKLSSFPIPAKGRVDLNSGVDFDLNQNLWIGFNNTVLGDNHLVEDISIESHLIKFDTVNHSYKKYMLPNQNNEFKGRQKAPSEAIGYIHDIKVGADDNIYITRWLAESITKFDPISESFEEIKTPPGFGVPGKIFKDGKNLWFESFEADFPPGAYQKILKYTVDSAKLKIYNQYAENSLAVGNDGLLYLTSKAVDETVVQYDSKIHQVTKSYNLGNSFHDQLLMSSDGNIWVTKSQEGLIKKFDPQSGEFVLEASFPLKEVSAARSHSVESEPSSVPQVYSPDIRDLEEDKDGNLYFLITSNYDKIYRVNGVKN